MKKFLAMLLAMVMVLGCTAFAETVNPDDIPDTVTSADGKYEIAFVTDVGQLKDKSFNQGTWNGVKSYAAANNLTYKYYQPANGNEATDDDRYDAMKAAAEGGAKVVVAAGFMQGNALTKAAIEFPTVNFVFIDGWPLSDAEGNVLANVAAISFQEEQAGYLAGYAVVRDGFTKLGFSGGGGGANAACDRYGYGFAQGANAAAKELGVEVELRYSWQYGASFSASSEL
ncbi:MAG: BMP family ABC transporter substrate-binding protein, partial [Clostridia bacterium]|nr:BMP family ABC transporter substrate-binding protein [Clostridia bacterium]